jgi:hypothetical protein
MPTIQFFPDRAHRLPDGHLLPVDGLSVTARDSAQQVQRAIFGFRFPYLPDFLADHTLIGETDPERLAELLERQDQFITNLWKWQGAGFSLRFSYQPQRAAVDVAFLARILAPVGIAQEAAEQLASDLRRLTQTFGLTPADIADAGELAAWRMPLSTPYVVEVRQREDVVGFAWANRDAYVVYSFWQPHGAFLQPFETLLRQGAECVINLHLEPTRLAAAEAQALAKAAAAAQTLSEWQRTSAHSVEYSGRWSDPQAVLVARTYSAQLRRLSQPFVMVAQVASPDRFAALSVAQTLGAAFTSRSGGQRSDEDPTSAFQVVLPANDADLQAATRTLNHLVLTPWGQSLAQESPDLIRLRYLADARGASALFRFPIAVRGGVPGIEVRQPMPDFEPGGRAIQPNPDEIHLGMYQRGGVVRLKVRDLARHGLVAGLPGSGKTNTCLFWLSQLQERGVPFTVIEPAKTEYRGLIRQPGFEDLLIFTLGDETTAPFRLNPFELLPGIRLEVHIEALNVAINAALPQFGVLPTIIEEALEEVYTRHGWRLTDRGPLADNAQPRRLFPTMAEFYQAAVQAVEGRGYRGELHDNILAAVKGRIGSLLRGSKGWMFNCRRSLPPDILFGRPVVLELDSLSDDVKALTMMFLLIMLREHRQAQARAAGGPGDGLQHLLLIEEAHRIMENVATVSNPEVSADTRAKAVRVITDFLVEMRAYGQGVLIAEQSPEKLVPDAVRNTNLKVGHMLPGRQDREALAAAMIMDEAQEQFMGKLRVGQAAVFMTGLEKATFMTVPNYKESVGFADFLPDSAVREHMLPFYVDNLEATLPFDGCKYCGEPCRHREAIEPVTRHKPTVEAFMDALKAFDRQPEPEQWPENWRGVAGAALDAAERAGRPASQEAAYCYLAHEIDFPFTEHMRRQFVRAIEALPASG